MVNKEFERRDKCVTYFYLLEKKYLVFLACTHCESRTVAYIRYVCSVECDLLLCTMCYKQTTVYRLNRN